MLTLRDVLLERKYSYKSFLTEKSEDIYFSTVNELCYSIGYILRHVKRIDAEIPEKQVSELSTVRPNYKIKTKYISSGNDVKWGKQYRIYFNSTTNMPIELKRRLQDDKKMRMTGSKFIEACFYIGFVPGSNQNRDLIINFMKEIFNDEEIKYFEYGYKG